MRNNINFSGCFSKDKIILLDDNKSLIYNLQNSNEKGSHWCSITRRNNTIYVFDSFGIGEIIPEIYNIYKNYQNNYKHIPNTRYYVNHYVDYFQYYLFYMM